MTRFALDVDPAALGAAASGLAAFEGDLQAAADGLTAVLPQVQSSWTGEAATALTAESEALLQHASAATAHFTTAGAALGPSPRCARPPVERYLDNPNRLDGQVLHGRAFGYLTTSVELRPQSERPGVVALNYAFVWEPGATGTPS